MNEKKQLTFDEFIKLPRSQQNVRYKELSDHDKFRARMNDWEPPPGTKPISEDELIDMIDGMDKQSYEEFKKFHNLK